MFNSKYTDLRTIKSLNRKPDFNNLLKVLRCEIPSRPTLFEFFLNDNLYEVLAGSDYIPKDDGLNSWRQRIAAYTNAGYDYTTIAGSDFAFTKGDTHSKASKSLNEGGLIVDFESFEKYNWTNPEDYDYSRLDILGKEMPEGMQIIVNGPGGVFENVIELTGYDNLCYMVADEPELVQKIFDEVGSRLLQYYKICGEFESVGALLSNDDWGFNTQTLLSTEDMKKYVIPWHKKIVEVIHSYHKPAILHSCGNQKHMYKEIIETIGYDGKHSYEDVIQPVEEAYELLKGKIAVLGGIDLDYVCRKTPEEVYNRSLKMLKQAKDGGFALGSGNSIPYYTPHENYLAMIAAALFNS